MIQIEVRERPLFEVANAYEMRSTELLRIAREELHLNIKSHMSVLSGDQYEVIVKHLKTSKKTDKSQASAVKKKTVVRKKAAPKKVEKTSVDVRTAMQAKVKKVETQEVTPKKAEESGPRLSKKTIVRRVVEEKKEAAAIEAKAAELSAPAQSTHEGAVVIAPPDPSKTIHRTRTTRDVGTGVPDLTDPTSIRDRRPTDKEEAARDSLKKTAKKLVQKTEVFSPVDYLKREQVYRTKRKRISRTSGLMAATPVTMPAAHKRTVEFRKPISVKDLAHQMKVKSADVMYKLKKMGSPINQIQDRMDFETASLVAQEYQYEVLDHIFTEERYFAALAEKAKDAPETQRPPVVTVMGHVDHGKTSILDALRESNVVGGESGGITQHIGAYTITVNDKHITFIDTPGHAAFTSMRKRGADVTDIVVLVVAANDGVMPQTREAIQHAQAAKVPILVAVNKIDLPDANQEKVRNQLSEHDLVSEEWGGDSIFVPVSALKKEGLDKLCESILLLAEMNEVKGNEAIYPQGVVIESKLDPARGPVATIIVTQGEFKVGDNIISELITGRVRQMRDASGNSLKKMGPGYAVEMSGLSTVASAGAKVVALPTTVDIQELLEYRKDHVAHTEEVTKEDVEPNMEDLMSRIGVEENKKLHFVIKTDAHGSEEALRGMIDNLKVEKGPEVKIVASGCGAVSESDVDLAKASGAILVAFHTRVDTEIRKKLENADISLIESNIIYEVMERIAKVIESGVEPELVIEEVGKAEIRKLFKFGKTCVAGSYVQNGKISRNSLVRIKRADQEIMTAKIVSLKRFKDDAKEVESGYECGIGLDVRESELKEGDVIEAYRQIEKKPGASV
jgi:translation initiation factor IF-2